MRYQVCEGNYARMGVTKDKDSVIFTFEGEKEDRCEIVLVDRTTMRETKVLADREFCMGSLRSVSIKHIDTENTLYYYAINGVPVLDPYAPGIAGREQWNDKNRRKQQYKVFGRMNFDEYSWHGDRNPEVARKDMVMYKLHVRGFTMENASKEQAAGTFLGLSQKLSYLKKLGITTVELMPVYEFEEMDIPVKQEMPEYLKGKMRPEDLLHVNKEMECGRKVNFWGYCAGNYFAVKTGYAFDQKNPEKELKDLVCKMHRMGMECVMEMYFPEHSNHNLVLEALHYWIREFHVDGFHLIGQDLPITAIVQDVRLSRTKIFYEAFDEVLLKETKKYKHLYVYKDEYQFPARKILNHVNGNMGEFLDQQRKQGVEAGFVNYLANNNGFTLADVFMYNDRHNEANGENNEDGCEWNFSNNYGVEGPTRKKYISDLRKRQWRNGIIMLMLAQGVPMIWAGDEMGNSQNGNNNAYCQDNPIGWTNWKTRGSHAELIDFVRHMIGFRHDHAIIAKETPFLFSDYKAKGTPDLSYHGESAWLSGIHPGRMSVGILYCGQYAPKDAENEDVYVGFNFFSGISTLALPKLSGKRKWYMAVNSADRKQPYYKDVVLYKDQHQLTLSPQSICILIGK